MRRLAIVALAMLCASAAVAGAATRRPALRMTVSGDLTGLGMKKIAIGRFDCTVPASLLASAGRFVIGDPVKLTCLGGRLQSVKYLPEKATAQTSVLAPVTVPPQGGRTTAPVAAAPVQAGGADSFTIHFGSVSLGPGASAAGGSSAGATIVSRTGPIAAIGDSSITVDDLTCNVSQFLLSNLLSHLSALQVGTDVTMICLSSGQIASLASAGG